MAGNKLIRIMQKAGRTPNEEKTDLLFGEVVSIAPLQIKVDNRFIVGSEFLVLSALVKEKKVGEMVLWEGLLVGDKVRLLRVNNGQLFYVMEKEVIIDDA